MMHEEEMHISLIFSTFLLYENLALAFQKANFGAIPKWKCPDIIFEALHTCTGL